MTLPAMSVSGDDPNSPLLAKPKSPASASRRPSSLKPSMRSSTSRITLVGYDTELEPKVNVIYGTTNTAKEFSWFDHLLGVFCISRRPKIKTRKTVSEIALEPKSPNVELASPWVLPVYVLSTERDEHRHLIPKEAKCTIDTGNLQGNIVSKEFVVDVLGYAEADFHKLTKEEENGGTGVTGHKLIPDGAIYLTWYHSNSTRVFRDMRFLISEHPMYDLIIGARSIRKNNILDVPNLMADKAVGRTLFSDPKSTPEIEELLSKMNKAEAALGKVIVEIAKAELKAKLKEDSSLLTKRKVAQENADKAREAWVDKVRELYEPPIRKAEDEKSTSIADALKKAFKDKTGTDFTKPKKE